MAINVSYKYALKVGFTLMLMTVFTARINISHSYWALFTIIAVMLPTVGATLARSKIRGFYTAGGVLLAGVVNYTLQGHPVSLLIVTLLALFLASYYIQLNYRLFVFFISFLLVFGLASISHESWHYMYWRFIDTVIGVIAAVMISILVFPCWSKNSIRKTLKDTLKDLSVFISQIFSKEITSLNALEESRYQLAVNTEKLKQQLLEMAHEVDESDNIILLYESLIHLIENVRFDGNLVFGLREKLDKHPCFLQLQAKVNSYLDAILKEKTLDENNEKILIADDYLNVIVDMFIHDLSRLQYTLSMLNRS